MAQPSAHPAGEIHPRKMQGRIEMFLEIGASFLGLLREQMPLVLFREAKLIL